MKRDRSKELLVAARQVIPGGVNSPVRAFRAVGGEPPFISRGKGASRGEQQVPISCQNRKIVANPVRHCHIKVAILIEIFNHNCFRS